MKKYLLMISNWLVIAMLILVMGACNDDDENEAGSEADLVGLWTTESVNFEITLNGEDFIQYLAQALGISESEAEAFAELAVGDLESNFTGIVDIKSDGTYVSTFGDETDDGTWSLSSDGKTLTLDAGTEFETSAEIVELTSNRLVLNISETEETEDVDGDNVNDELVIDIDLTMTK